MNDALWKSEVDADAMGGFEVYVSTQDNDIRVYSSRDHDFESARELAKALMAAADYAEARDHE
jgi:hypothetical protein